MDWLQNLFVNTESIAHIIVLFALVISVGIGLGRIKMFGISLGVTFVLFAGILAGHLYNYFGSSPGGVTYACPLNVLGFPRFYVQIAVFRLNQQTECALLGRHHSICYR